MKTGPGFRRKIFILLTVAILVNGLPAYAQIDLEAIARLHFKVEEDSANWFEGFARARAGTSAPYASHRSMGAPVPAYVVRTQGSESTMAWETASLPSPWQGNTVTYLWACGLGNNLGDGKFVLDFNDGHTFAFSTPMEPAWRIKGEAGATLAFTAVLQNHNRAFLGYMALRVPAAWVPRGQPSTLKITGKAAPKEIWYRTFAYTDALAFLRTLEHQEVFTGLEFWNMGEATIHIVSQRKKAGQTIEAYYGNELIDKNIFQLEDSLAVAWLKIPRELQRESSEAFELRLAGKRVTTVDLRGVTEQRLKAFLEEELIAARFVFPPGELPRIEWKRPAMVDNELGKFKLHVSYFDKGMQQVTSAGETGRYAAVVEGTTPAGFTIKRYLTLYCAPIELDDYGDEVSIRINALPALGIRPAVWQKYEKNLPPFSFGNLIHYLYTSADAAIFLAGLSEMDSLQQGLDSPRLRDRQWWIEFERRQERPQARPPLFKTQPQHAEVSTPQLLDAGNGSSPFTRDDLQKIREAALAWAHAGGEPLAALLAHRGHIVFHEAFGRQRDGTAMTIDTRTWMASITKLLTGVLVMQFVDQGLLDLDAPLQNYLPELEQSENSALTLRHLFTHTHGGAWHGEWGSDWNPALENLVTHGLPYFAVGKKFQYNRLGYALAGKIMERLSGRAVPHLFEACLFKPLGMNHSTVDNTYGSLYSTCADFARLGQMLLNRGCYGEWQFFSEGNFHKMLPASLETINPNLQKRWGIGMAPLGGHGLSERTFGHEAASGAIFRVDPEQDLILVVARDRTGSNYEHYAARFIEACTVPLRRSGEQ
ncbi:MAG: serine hydrolase domain-containing protein [bacterium]